MVESFGFELNTEVSCFISLYPCPLTAGIALDALHPVPIYQDTGRAGWACAGSERLERACPSRGRDPTGMCVQEAIAMQACVIGNWPNIFSG